MTMLEMTFSVLEITPTKKDDALWNAEGALRDINEMKRGEVRLWNFASPINSISISAVGRMSISRS